jgi:hypothetical protein
LPSQPYGIMRKSLRTALSRHASLHFCIKSFQHVINQLWQRNSSHSQLKIIPLSLSLSAHKMESMSQKQARGRLQLPTRQALGEGSRVRRNNQVVPIPPRPRSTCTCSNRPGSVRCSKHGYMVPGDKLIRRHQANKELLRRALAPPNRRLTLRWFNFRPTPSRLSNMSMA